MPPQKQGTTLTTRVYFHTYTKALATHFGTCPISPFKWNAMSFTTAQIPFLIKNMLSALKSPLASIVHFVKNLTVLFRFSQGVNNIISGMITECHNVACRLIMKAISKGSLARCIVHMDAGSTDRFAQQNLRIPKHASNRTLPIWPRSLCWWLS